MPKLGKAFIQIYLLLVIALFLWNAVSVLRYPYGIDYGEAPLVDQARRILSKGALYKPNIDEPPYVIANYPPAYPSLVALTNWLSGIPLFQAGRLASILFSAVCGYIIGLFTFHLTKNKWLGLFSAAVFWGQPYVIYWSSITRVDLMALAFSLLGLWVVFRYRNKTLAIVIATLFFLISVYSRQTYILAGPLAAFTWLWHINRKSAALFFSLFSIFGLLIFGTINALSNGGFYSNIILSNINHFNLSNVLSAGTRLFILWPLFVMIALSMMILTIFTTFKHPSDDRFALSQQPFITYGLVFYTLAGTAMAFTIGKIGSNVNYLLEFIAACSIWIGIAWKVVLDQRRSMQWIFFSLLIIQSMWILMNSYGLINQNIQLMNERKFKSASLEGVVKLASQDGTVLSDDYMDLIVLAGQHIYYQPFEYGELYTAGQWEPSKFVNQIQNHEFPLIIIGGDKLNKDCCWPPPVQLALEANYQIVQQENFLILTPK